MKLSSAAEIFLFRLFLRLVAAIPLSIRSAAGFASGFLFSFIPTRDRKVAVLQLRRFLPEHANFLTVARVYAHIGQNIMESINLLPVLADPDRYITVHGIELANQYFDAGKGIVALTAHTGNWELLAGYIIKQGIPVYTAAREARNPLFQELLAELRAKYGIQMLWRAGALNSQKKILSTLKKRAVVAALIDQDTQVSGSCVPFFGQPAFTPTALGEIARRFDTGLVTVFMIRTGFLKFEVFIEPIDNSLSAEEIAHEFNRRLETLIRSYPSQWVWFHKRWRTKHEGHRLSSREYIAELRAGLSNAS